MLKKSLTTLIVVLGALMINSTQLAIAQNFAKPEIEFNKYSVKEALREVLEHDFKEEDRTIMSVAGKPGVIFFYPNEWHLYKELEYPEMQKQLGMDWANCAISALVSSYSIGEVRRAEPPRIAGSHPGTERFAVRVKMNVIAFSVKIQEYFNVPSKWCTWQDLEITDTKTGTIDKIGIMLPPLTLGALAQIDRLGKRTANLPDYRGYEVPAHRRQWEFTVYMSYGLWPETGPLGSYERKYRLHIIRPFFPIHYSVDAQVERAREGLARALIKQKDCNHGERDQFNRCDGIEKNIEGSRRSLESALKYKALANQ